MSLVDGGGIDLGRSYDQRQILSVRYQVKDGRGQLHKSKVQRWEQFSLYVGDKLVYGL